MSADGGHSPTPDNVDPSRGVGVTGSTPSTTKEVAVRSGGPARVTTGQYQRWQPGDPFPLQTTVGLPGGRHRSYVHADVYAGPAIRSIAPLGLFGSKISEADFRAGYARRLTAQGADLVDEVLRLVQANGPVVVLCWCKIEEHGSRYCHRRMFADWWEETTGEEVPELHWHTPKRAKRAPVAPQAQLFSAETEGLNT